VVKPDWKIQIREAKFNKRGYHLFLTASFYIINPLSYLTNNIVYHIKYLTIKYYVHYTILMKYPTVTSSLILRKWFILLKK